MADAMMESLGEANGVKWYWAEPGRFERPGVYYWDGTSNVLCVPYPAKPEAPAQAAPSAGEVERYRKDAERYRWLCSHAIVPSPSLWDFGVAFAAQDIKQRRGQMHKVELDAAIDAALSHKEQQP